MLKILVFCKKIHEDKRLVSQHTGGHLSVYYT